MSKKRVLFCGEFSGLNTGYSKYAKEVLSRLHATNKYEIAEHGCYADPNEATGRIRSLMQNTPWKVYGNMPENKDQQVMYDSSAVNAFGAWKFESICLDFKPHTIIDIRDYWMCLTKDANIVTYDGIKKIIDIKVNDIVLTHKGRYKKVINKFERHYNGNINIIKSMYCPFDVSLTDGHHILGIKRGNTNLNLPELSPNNLKWIESQNIEKGDIVVYPVDDFGKNKLSLDRCRLIGYYTAEGCLMYEGRKKDRILKGIQLTFNASEKEYINDLINIIKKEYDKEAKLKVINNTAIIRVFDRKIAKDMELYASSLAGNKHWNNKIFHMDKNCTKHLLCGLFRGDGGHYKNRATYCTKSEQLAHQVFRLCLRFGILSSFNKNKNKIKDKIYHRYIFSFAKGDSLDGFINIYNLQNQDIKSHKRICNKYAYLTVRNVEKKLQNIKIYNFEVEDDNTYVSSFCLHNCSHEENSPFRPYYNLVWMPTVDSYPQNAQWLSSYASADAIFTYNDWSAELLKRESGGKINVIGSAPPSASDVYQPLDKDEVRKKSGIDKKYKIVGMISRNQRRKLYPDLFAGFRMFLNNTGRNDVLLYCHTSFPDAGWDIPKLLLQHGLASKVLFTYRCQKCEHAFPAFFSDALTQCVRCNMPTASLPNVQNGVSDEVLSVIINMFDVYVQYANSEGFGIGQVEAAACGVPIMSVDYSAMSDIVRKLKGYPIKVLTLIEEVETGCMRAKPDNNHFAKKLEQFFKTSDEQRKAKSIEVRAAFEEHYNWDETAKKWEDCIDSFETKDLWKSPPRIHQPAEYQQPNMNNHDYIRWLITNVLCEPERLGSYLELRLVRDLNYGMTAGSLGGTMFSDGSTYSAKNHYTKFKHREAYDHMLKMCLNRNSWEQRRVQA